MQSVGLLSYGIAWKNCFRSIRQGKIFLLFVAYAILQTAGVFVLMQFAFPPFSSFLVPLMRMLYGDSVLHYPNNFLVLPVLFFWYNLLLSGILGIVLVGVTTKLFSKSFQSEAVDFRRSFGLVKSRYFYLFGAWLVETAVLVLVLIYLPKLLDQVDFIAARSNLIKQLLASLVAIVATSLFTYTTVLIMLDQDGPFQAIRRSFGLFLRFPVVTILLIALPNMVRMPMDLLSGRPAFLISKFSPEVVAGTVVLSIFVSMFTNYFLVGTVTSYYGSIMQRGARG